MHYGAICARRDTHMCFEITSVRKVEARSSVGGFDEFRLRLRVGHGDTPGMACGGALARKYCFSRRVKQKSNGRPRTVLIYPSPVDHRTNCVSIA